MKNEILDELCPDDRLNYKSRLKNYIILEKLREIKTGQYIRYFVKNDKCQAKCALTRGGIVMYKNGTSIVLKSLGKYSKKWTIKLEKGIVYLFRKKTKTDTLMEVFMNMNLGNLNINLEEESESESESEKRN